jgi:hypothetical protein
MMKLLYGDPQKAKEHLDNLCLPEPDNPFKNHFSGPYEDLTSVLQIDNIRNDILDYDQFKMSDYELIDPSTYTRPDDLSGDKQVKLPDCDNTEKANKRSLEEHTYI